MKRRQFLSLLGLSFGSVLIPAPVARLIRDTCVLNQQSLIIPTRSKNAATLLTAVWNGDAFTIHYGDPDEEPLFPSWGEFIERHCIDFDHPKHRADFLESFLGWDRRSGEPEPSISFGSDISGSAKQYYLDWDYELKESPTALAYNYLEELPLCDPDKQFSGEPLGELSFIEGDRPGSNLTCVDAPDYATLACLQHRLIELGEDVKIEIQTCS